VEIYDLDPALLADWAPPQVAPYKGYHGMHPDQVAWKG
jgi:hypothetical protein